MKVGDYVRFKTLSREIKIGKVIDIITLKNWLNKIIDYIGDDSHE